MNRSTFDMYECPLDEDISEDIDACFECAYCSSDGNCLYGTVDMDEILREQMKDSAWERSDIDNWKEK